MIFNTNSIITWQTSSVKELLFFYNLIENTNLAPTITKKSRHSADSVDRDIRDYKNVKLFRTATNEIDKIAQITYLCKRVIKQYLDLIITDDEIDGGQQIEGVLDEMAIIRLFR